MPREPSKPAACPEPAGDARQRLACRILLAEDGPDNQRLIAFLLRKAGAEVKVAENGQMALDFALAAGQAGKSIRHHSHGHADARLDGYEATREMAARLTRDRSLP